MTISFGAFHNGGRLTAPAQTACAPWSDACTSSAEQLLWTHCVTLETKVSFPHRQAVSLESQPEVSAVAMQVRRQSGVVQGVEACMVENGGRAEGWSKSWVGEGRMKRDGQLDHPPLQCATHQGRSA